MAIVRTAGTEIIRTVNLEAVNDSTKPAIIGVQHHIYTVLSIVCYANSLNSAGDYVRCYLTGFDALAGESAQDIYIFKQGMNAGDTFVWNDKFSFCGCEPDWSGASGGMTTAAEQDLIADQGTATVQTLKVDTEHSSDNVDIIVTYIDQNIA